MDGVYFLAITGEEGLEPPTNGFGDRYSAIELLPYRRDLLCFFVQHVLAHERIILRQFKTSGGITTIFKRVIHVAAFAAAELDQNAIAFFSHVAALSYEPTMSQKVTPI
jgi:hypothetical protein